MPTAIELREERATVIAEARRKWSEAEAREGGSTAEDQAALDLAMDGADKLLERAKRQERLDLASADLDEPQERRSAPIDEEQRGARREGERAEARDVKEKADFRHWMMTGEVRESIKPNARGIHEYRDTIIATDAKGGYLIAPTRLSSDIVSLVRNQVFIRRLGRFETVTDAKKLGIRKITADMGDADWTTEVQAVTEDTTMAFDLRQLEPYKISKLAKVSNRTLALSADAESIIRDQLAYKFAVTEEKAFLTGNGSSKPLGVFTASASGISTGRDVSTGNTTTAIGADNLFEVVYSINQGYLTGPGVGWVFHRDAVKAIRKLKDSQNQYLWQPGLQAGQPDMLLNHPVYMSEYAPNTFTTGLYVGCFGNFSYYRGADLNVMFIQRLIERYADTDEVGFIGRRWVDGAPILEQAFARVKLA